MLAAAIACRAEYIVSFNERDFPPSSLSRYGIEVCHPDCFLLGLSERDGDAFLKAIRDDLVHYRHPSLDVDAYSEALRRAGVPKTADHLRGMRALLQA